MKQNATDTGTILTGLCMLYDAIRTRDDTNEDFDTDKAYAALDDVADSLGVDVADSLDVLKAYRDYKRETGRC